MSVGACRSMSERRLGENNWVTKVRAWYEEKGALYVSQKVMWWHFPFTIFYFSCQNIHLYSHHYVKSLAFSLAISYFISCYFCITCHSFVILYLLPFLSPLSIFLARKFTVVFCCYIFYLLLFLYYLLLFCIFAFPLAVFYLSPQKFCSYFIFQATLLSITFSNSSCHNAIFIAIKSIPIAML